MVTIHAQTEEGCVDLAGLKVEESHQSSNVKSLLKQPGPG